MGFGSVVVVVVVVVEVVVVVMVVLVCAVVVKYQGVVAGSVSTGSQHSK